MDYEREPMVTPADMKRLRDLWPPAIFNHMKWFQQDIDLMRKSAKREFSQERPMPFESDSGQHVPSCGQTPP